MDKKLFKLLALPLFASLLSGCVMYNGKPPVKGDDTPTPEPSGDDDDGGDTPAPTPSPVPTEGGVYLVLGPTGYLLEEGKEANYGKSFGSPMFIEHAIFLEGNVGDALPGKDKIKSTVSGSEFVSWMTYEGKGAPTTYTTIPDGKGAVLYASFSGGSGSVDPTPGPVDPSGMHGPDGSVAVSWYICGTGSLWAKDDWSLTDGVQLFSNPGNQNDKGCILSVPFTEGDVFKVTDGTTWFGYTTVDQWDDPSNKGRSNFEGVDDGYGSLNIRCKVSGSYNMYVNAEGSFWIESAS